MKKSLKKNKENCYIIILLSFLLVMRAPVISDDITDELYFIETEVSEISKEVLNAPASIKIKVLINQFNQYDDIDARTDAINAAAKLGVESKLFFEHIYSLSQNISIKIEALKAIYKYKLNFKDIILSAADSSNDSIAVLGIECAVNLNDSDKHTLIENIFLRKNNSFYISHLLPVLFLNPEFNKIYIRRILFHDDLELRMSCYKYLVNAAPKLFDIACLGMFDENAFINRFILSKYKLYGENEGKQILYYGVNSSEKTVSDYAKTLLYSNY